MTMVKRAGLVFAVLLGVFLSGPVGYVGAQLTENLTRAYLWPDSETEFQAASDLITDDDALVGVSRQQMHDLEEWMRRGPLPAGGTAGARGDVLDEFAVSTPGGRQVPVFVRLPSRYDSQHQWPVMFAMHGGPPGSVDGAIQSARRMINVWAEPAEAAGWIVVSPAMVDVVSGDGRTQDRLPYEIFHPEEARAVLDAVRVRYSVNTDRIVSTGISLGSNFSIAYGAGHPDWLSAIVPVSTEGDSRELLLRNLAPVPTYVLEGSQDQNIRGVSGPRSLEEILTSFSYDLVYREFSDRAHEGFQEHYPDVLRWLDSRPRSDSPREVLRVPHDGIVPVSRSVHWVEANTRQAFVYARVQGPAEIEIIARWANRITLLLNDRLVNLDEPLTIRINGDIVHHGLVERSMRVALEEARRLGDERRVYSARLTLPVPATVTSNQQAIQAWEALSPTHPQGQLSFWEMYAVRALEERVPTVGFEGTEEALPEDLANGPEQVGVRVTAVEPNGPAAAAGLQPGDLLVSFGDEPFFRERGGVAGLHHWLIRELRETAQEYELVLWRGGSLLTLDASYVLGPYSPPGDT